MKFKRGVLSEWHSSSDKPLVSVCCTAYNHEKYIAQAIDGFIMQETNFPFEIIINDDCSLDSTKNIIVEYLEKYPKLIRLISNDCNQYSVYSHQPMLNTFNAANGKYIALCEGDDYWTSSDKLQRQIDYLESNPECSMSTHGVEFLFDQVDEKRRGYVLPEVMSGDLEDVIKYGVFIAYNSIVFRKSLFEFPLWMNKIQGSHKFIIFLLSSKGKYQYINANLAVKRRNPNGVTVSMQSERNKRYIDNNIFLLCKMKEIVNCKYYSIIDKKLSSLYLRKAYRSIKGVDPKSFLFSVKMAFLTYIKTIKR